MLLVVSVSTLAANTAQFHLVALLSVKAATDMFQTRPMIQMSAVEGNHRWRRTCSRGLADLEEFLLANRTHRIRLQTDACHLRLHSIRQSLSSTPQSLVQFRHIGSQNGVAALAQLQLQSVVVQHVHQLLLELRDLHSLRNALHQRDCIDVLSRAIQQCYVSPSCPISTSHELRLHDGVPHEIVPQISVLPLLDELQRHVHVAELLDDHL